MLNYWKKHINVFSYFNLVFNLKNGIIIKLDSGGMLCQNG